MARGPRYAVKFRRRREGVTDYRKRLKLLLSGKPRLVIRRTNTRIIVQIIEYDPKGDRVLVHADSTELRKKYGWKYSLKCLPAAYLTGYLAGIKAKNKGIGEVILDIGRFRVTKGNRLFAAFKGFLDAGGKAPHRPTYFPDESRIRGEHIKAYAALLKSQDPEKYKRLFSRYIREGADPEKIPEEFERVLEKIKKEGAGNGGVGSENKAG